MTSNVQLPDRELWRFISNSGTTVTALCRAVEASWMHPTNRLVGFELRIMNGDDLHPSESFRSEQDLHRRSEELRQQLIKRGWQPAELRRQP